MARILTLTNWYPPHHFGGYEVLCADVMHGLHERGHEVQVLCSDEEIPSAPTTETSPFPVHRRLRMYWRDGLPWTPPARHRLATERANQRALQQALDDFAPDVISVWHMGALSLNLLTTVQERGIPMVFAVCDEWLIYGIALDPWSRTWNPNPLRRAAGRLARPLLRTPTVLGDLGAAGCFCFLSRFTRASSRAASPWTYPVDPVIYPGIERAMFPPPDPDRPRPWGWTLLYTGRLDPRKGTDTLLRAMTKLPPEATVSFLGRGEPVERDRVQRLAEELGLAEQVRIEPITRAELPEAYASHDCFVFPSEWPEPFGMVPIEAMACGTPVVGTGVGGSGEFLADGVNCLVFTPGDEVGLADAVRRLADDDGLRATLRTNGWVTADQFDLASTIEAYDACHAAAAERRLDTLDLPPHPSAATAPAPETAPEPRPLGLTDRSDGPVLHLGTPAGARRAVAVVDTARRAAPGHPCVVADPGRLPFADGAFAGVVCQDTVGRVPDPDALVAELARVCRPGGALTVVTPNRHNAATLRVRLEHRWKGWRRSPAQYAAVAGQRRAYSWAELEALLSRHFVVTARRPIGWGDSPRRRLAARTLVGPLRALSQSICIEARPTR